MLVRICFLILFSFSSVNALCYGWFCGNARISIGYDYSQWDMNGIYFYGKNGSTLAKYNGISPKATNHSLHLGIIYKVAAMIAETERIHIVGDYKIGLLSESRIKGYKGLGRDYIPNMYDRDPATSSISTISHFIGINVSNQAYPLFINASVIIDSYSSNVTKGYGWGTFGVFYGGGIDGKISLGLSGKSTQRSTARTLRQRGTPQQSTARQEPTIMLEYFAGYAYSPKSHNSRTLYSWKLNSMDKGHLITYGLGLSVPISDIIIIFARLSGKYAILAESQRTLSLTLSSGGNANAGESGYYLIPKTKHHSISIDLGFGF